MNDLDILIKERLIPFRERLLDLFKEKHPNIITILQAILAGHENKVGLRVTENGKVVGEYTFIVTGLKVTGLEIGKLESAVKHPFLGLIKPYATMEKSAIAAMIDDEAAFTDDFFKAAAKYLPDLTVNFLR